MKLIILTTLSLLLSGHALGASATAKVSMQVYSSVTISTLSNTAKLQSTNDSITIMHKGEKLDKRDLQKQKIKGVVEIIF